MENRRIVYTGLFVAIGIILPQAVHMVGGPGMGSVLLPMHIPVLIGAMLLGPLSGVFIALGSVLVGMALGMPPVHIGLFMLLEMSVYALVSGLMYYKKNLNVYVSLVLAMLLGRMTLLIVANLALRLFTLQVPPVYGTLLMFVPGIPGMIGQLVLVPILVITLKMALKRNQVNMGVSE